MEEGNISGTSVALVKIKLKKETRKTRSDSQGLNRVEERENQCDEFF